MSDYPNRNFQNEIDIILLRMNIVIEDRIKKLLDQELDNRIRTEVKAQISKMFRELGRISE